MYRINWKSRRTGKAGHGEPVFLTRGEASKIAEEHNRQHKKYPGNLPGGLLYHWAEFVPDENEQRVGTDG